MSGGRYRFLGVPVDDCSMAEAVDEAMGLARGDDPGYVLFLNTDVIVKADKNEMLLESIEGSRLSLMDGKPPLTLARLMGLPLREKVSGSDFVPELCSAAAAAGLSMFILGGSEEAAAGAAKNIKSNYLGIGEVGWYSPPIGFEQSVDGLVDAVEHVRAARPDVLVVCLGCPKQEVLVGGLLEEFGAPCVVCAGATVDFMAGTAKRAPEWVSAVGAEWLYRFAHDPKRLFKRYFVESWHIAGMIMKASWFSRDSCIQNVLSESGRTDSRVSDS